MRKDCLRYDFSSQNIREITSRNKIKISRMSEKYISVNVNGMTGGNGGDLSE